MDGRKFIKRKRPRITVRQVGFMGKSIKINIEDIKRISASGYNTTTTYGFIRTGSIRQIIRSSDEKGSYYTFVVK